MDVGTFSKCTLLTGAGWSHNWGARLAVGVWQLIMDNPEVAANDRLRTLLLDEPSFEVALAKSQVAPFTTDDREQFKRALIEAFVSMDRAMTRPFDGSPGTINIYKVQELLFRFAGQRGQGVDTGYYFTLNQDLFPERRLYNHHVSGASLHHYPASSRHRVSLCSPRILVPIRSNLLCVLSLTRPGRDDCAGNSTSSNSMDHLTGACLTRAMFWWWGQTKLNK